MLKGVTRLRRCRRAPRPCPISSARRCSGCAKPIIFPCPISPSNRASPNRSSARLSATKPIPRWRRSGAFRRLSTSRSSACCRRPTTALSWKNPRAATPRSSCRRMASAGSPLSAGSRRSNGCSGMMFAADPGGVLESDAHQRGSVENLSVSEGEFEVEVGGAD